LKILFVGDACILSGFSIVTHNICNILSKDNIVVVYGIGYDGMKRNPYPYYIYPAKNGGDLYSFSGLQAVIDEEEPDCLIVFNDDRIILKYLDHTEYRGNIIPFFPVNFTPINKDVSRLNTIGIKSILSYTNYSTNEIGKLYSGKVTPVYHGVDTEVFKKDINAKDKMNLSGSFVVGITGTNTYRKRFDLFIEAFSKFSMGKNDVLGIIHTAGNESCYDLNYLAEYYNISDKLLINHEDVDFYTLNVMYNAFDVHCSTTMGEGFALPLLESSVSGVPILCTDCGNLKDIWGDSVDYIKSTKECIPNSKYFGDRIVLEDMVNKLEKLYRDREYRLHKSTLVKKNSQNEKFLWGTVTNKVLLTICE
jgi:glycosyltransferase involved in cell wall biosynthesis